MDDKLLAHELMGRGIERRRAIAMLGGLALLPVACSSDDGDAVGSRAPAGKDETTTTGVRLGLAGRTGNVCSDLPVDGPEESVRTVQTAIEALGGGGPEQLRELLAEEVELRAVTSTGEVVDVLSGPDRVAESLTSVVADPEQLLPVAGGVLVPVAKDGCGTSAAFVEVVGSRVMRISSARLPG